MRKELIAFLALVTLLAGAGCNEPGVTDPESGEVEDPPPPQSTPSGVTSPTPPAQGGAISPPPPPTGNTPPAPLKPSTNISPAPPLPRRTLPIVDPISTDKPILNGQLAPEGGIFTRRQQPPMSIPATGSGFACTGAYGVHIFIPELTGSVGFGIYAHCTSDQARESEGDNPRDGRQCDAEPKRSQVYTVIGGTLLQTVGLSRLKPHSIVAQRPLDTTAGPRFAAVLPSPVSADDSRRTLRPHCTKG
jgi:hypothetical protein